MGQLASKIYSSAIREIKMYNIERRAEKVISKDKPTPAPTYPSTAIELQRLKEENISTEHLDKKDKQLDEYLKKVYVTTPGPIPMSERDINPKRPLPLNRHSDNELTFGYSESEETSVPPGRVSLKQAIQFISDNQSNPDNHTSAAIAAQYKLDVNTTNNILEHFKMFSVHMKKKGEDPALLSSYSQLQNKIKQMSLYNAKEIVAEIKIPKINVDSKGIEVKEINDISPDVNAKKDSTRNINTEKSKENR